MDEEPAVLVIEDTEAATRRLRNRRAVFSAVGAALAMAAAVGSDAGERSVRQVIEDLPPPAPGPKIGNGRVKDAGGWIMKCAGEGCTTRSASGPDAHEMARLCGFKEDPDDGKFYCAKCRKKVVATGGGRIRR
jgi:hypothetical protein